MARKKENIADFDSVADINNNNKINAKENNSNNDELDNILLEKENKGNTHILKGIYFEREVARAIDRVSRGKGKGVKSDLVNAAVKQVFKEKGWL